MCRDKILRFPPLTDSQGWCTHLGRFNGRFKSGSAFLDGRGERTILIKFALFGEYALYAYSGTTVQPTLESVKYAGLVACTDCGLTTKRRLVSAILKN